MPVSFAERVCGSPRRLRHIAVRSTRLVWVPALLAALVAGGPGAQWARARAFPNDVAVDPASPWPEMRHDRRNTGRSDIRGHYQGDRPWQFATGKGIFSTPVLGRDETVYVGSADTRLYAIGPGGRLRWSFRTGGVIDSAGVVGSYDPAERTHPLAFGSGDEVLYRLRTGAAGAGRPRVIWRYRASLRSTQGQLVNWWEGNVEAGFDGTLYAGNTGGTAYAIRPDGRARWIYPAGNSVWTAAAIGEDSTTYWGSLDFSVHAVDAAGQRRWSRPTAGFVISSPALAADGTLYVGSFDGRLYALDVATGAVRWSFATADNVYSSPALDEDRQGRTRGVYIASTDGSVYKLTATGRLVWRYETGDVVRSSPALGRAPAGGGRIVYVGSANGVLYALDAASGRRRWSFDTTARDPVLRDRNDLNSSPSLGRTGVYIGSEDGSAWYVPYDYCLHERDRRCRHGPGQAFPPRVTQLYPVSAGGTTEPGTGTRDLAPATVLPLRLVVRRGGRTMDASLDPASIGRGVSVKPGFAFATALSGDGHYLYVVPRTFLAAGSYALRVAARYGVTGVAAPVGGIRQTVRLRVRRSRGVLPLAVSSSRSSAFELTRLAVPLPPFLPSINQIGFDSYDWIVTTVARSAPNRRGEGRLLLWVAGARRAASGALVADRARSFGFPLVGRYRRDAFIVSARDVPLTFSFARVPTRLLELRGSLGSDLRVRPGASLHSEVVCTQVPYYGPLLRFTRLCNRQGRIVVSGTFITRAYRGGVVRRPLGPRLRAVTLRRPSTGAAGAVTARLAVRRGTRYPASRHVASILLVDARDGRPVAMDYPAATSQAAGPHGDLAAVRLKIPPRTALPRRLLAYVITDAFALGSRAL